MAYVFNTLCSNIYIICVARLFFRTGAMIPASILLLHPTGKKDDLWNHLFCVKGIVSRDSVSTKTIV
jgi:hypothetical protein